MTTLIQFARDIWGGLTDRISQEPVLTQGVVVAGVALGTAFGLGWDGVQVGAVTAFSAAFLSLVARQKVSPTG